MFVTIAKSIISVFISLACVFATPLNLWTKSDYTPKDPENVKLTFATMSDIHMTDSSFIRFLFELGLKDLSDSEYKLDALCLLGDNTDSGYIEQYKNLDKAFSKYDSAKNIILNVGNHDTWTENYGGELAHKLFKEYYSKFTGKEINNVYFTNEINGYHFISISSEKNQTYAIISDEQIQWLDEQLKEASKDDKPIFVMSHWPINQTHGLPGTFEEGATDPLEGGLGEQSDKINAVLQKYENVFYITGHIHNGITNEFSSKLYGYNSVQKHGNVTCVNLPTYTNFTLRGFPINGTGFVFEVYDDEVIIRSRSYMGGFWMNNYEFKIDLE